MFPSCDHQERIFVAKQTYPLVSGSPFPCAEAGSADGWLSSREPCSRLLSLQASYQLDACVLRVKVASKGPNLGPRNGAIRAAALCCLGGLKQGKVKREGLVMDGEKTKFVTTKMSP